MVLAYANLFQIFSLPLVDYFDIHLINKSTQTNNNKTSGGWQITFYVIDILEVYKTKRQF